MIIFICVFVFDAHASPQKETINLRPALDSAFKTILTGCGQTTDEQKYYLKYAENYYDSLRESVDPKNDGISELVSNFNVTLDGLARNGCSLNAINNFKKELNPQLQEIYVKKLNQFKSEIVGLKDKKLSPSIAIDKMKRFISANSLSAELIMKYVSQSDLDFVAASGNKRKKSCSDTFNLKQPLSLDHPRSEDSIGLCFSDAASDLVANKIGKNPSAVYSYYQVQNKFFWRMFDSQMKDKGFINTAVNEMINNGICLEEDLPSGDYRFSEEGKSILKIFDALEVLANDVKNSKLSTEGLKCAVEKQLQDIQVIFPKLSSSDFVEIIQTSSQKDVIKNLIKKNCKIYSDSKLKGLKIKSTIGQKNIFNTIDEQLNKGEIIGIHYSSDIFKNFSSVSSIPDHSGTIVARRFDEKTQTCQYLLRNSWGTGCYSYNSVYECINGHIWIDEAAFKYDNTILQAIYLE